MSDHILFGLVVVYNYCLSMIFQILGERKLLIEGLCLFGEAGDCGWDGDFGFGVASVGPIVLIA